MEEDINLSSIYLYPMDDYNKLSSVLSNSNINYSQENILNEKYSNDIQYSLLLNKINNINNELNNISINDLKFVKMLEEWRIQSHNKIEIFSKKLLYEYINRTKEDFDYLRNLINSIIINLNNTNNFIDSIDKKLKCIKENFDKIKNLEEFQLKSLEIDETINYFPYQLNKNEFNTFEESNESNLLLSQSNSICSSLNEFNSYHLCLSTQNCFYPDIINPYKIINLISDNWFTLSTNNSHILTISKSYLYLFNKFYKIIYKKLLLKQDIKDICWSNYIEKFILITSKDIYYFDDKTMILSRFNINYNIDKPWQCVTSSEENLFLSTFGKNPFIIEFKLNSSINFNKIYQSNIISNQYEIINDIQSNEDYISIIIENDLVNKSFLQIRSLKTFQCISIILLGYGWSYKTYPFNNQYWIVINKYNNQISYINNDGTICKNEFYLTKPCNIVSWQNNQIIIRTFNTLNIHQCQ